MIGTIRDWCRPSMLRVDIETPMRGGRERLKFVELLDDDECLYDDDH